MSYYGYDWYPDEFYGDYDSVAYCRWLYNRFGAEHTASVLKFPKKLVDIIGNSRIPGRTQLSEVNSIKSAEKLKESIDTNNNTIEKKTEFQKEFHNKNSRKIKIRLNKLSEIPQMYVLRNLIEAEEHNIKAKVASYKYREEHYSKKVEYIRNALTQLPNISWNYWYQRKTDGKAKYIFFVETPAGQVSWHGTDLEEMKKVPNIQEDKWDKARAVTLPRLLESVYKLCPSILKEQFNKEKLKAEILNNINRDLNMTKQTTITLGTSAHRFKSSVSVWISLCNI